MTSFLVDVDPSLHYEVVPITDPYGPTITDPDIDCIVVSAETKLGGEKVNVERKNRVSKAISKHFLKCHIFWSQECIFSLVLLLLLLLSSEF